MDWGLGRETEFAEFALGFVSLQSITSTVDRPASVVENILDDVVGGLFLLHGALLFLLFALAIRACQSNSYCNRMH